MTIKELGIDAQGYSSDNGTGDFKFDEFAVNQSYTPSGNTAQYPGIEAFADFRHYEIYGINLTVTEPLSGLTGLTTTWNESKTASYSANFSSAKDEFQIQILQSNSGNYVEAEYNIISSSGTSLMTWTWTDSLSGETLKPPYENVAVSDELDGLEKFGYAQINSGTDFQIESVIHPDTATDFTGHQVTSFTSSTSNTLSISACSLNSFVDEEGAGAGTGGGTNPYTYGTSGSVSASNEYYQYYEDK